MYQRSLDLKALLSQHRSYFLFGPRSTGKSSLLQHQLTADYYFDLLDGDTFEELMRSPSLLEHQIKGEHKLVIIDEIQKLPKLLDQIHRLIEKKGHQFLLTGSSASKIKRQGANLLGGRALEAHLFPLTWKELGADFDLFKYLNFGGIPRHYLSVAPKEDLKAYCRLYLAEEIKAEALVRNYDRFVRFLETMAINNGQELIYKNISSDSGVPERTVEGYVEVLKDTLIGFELLPFLKSKKRKAIQKSKFYFFDPGVSNYFSDKLPLAKGSSDLGILFEQFILMEIRAYNSYSQKNLSLSYWGTRSFEVDLIVGKNAAIEIKYSQNVDSNHLKGLKAFREEKQVKDYYLVGRYKFEQERDGIKILPYEVFLERLWAGEIF